MTATPAVFPEGWQEQALRDVPASVIYDLRDKCNNIFPAAIKFIKTKEAKKMIAKMTDRWLYFTNCTKTIDEFAGTYDIDKNTIVSVFSKSVKKDLLTKEELELMEAAEKQLTENGHYLPQIRGLIATARLKEGVDISDDVSTIFVESHIESDIIQMVGRLRKGVKTMYVITDAPQFDIDFEKERQNQIGAKKLISCINQGLSCEQSGLTHEQNEFSNQYLINVALNANNPYILYSHRDRQLCYYEAREQGINYIRDGLKTWNDCDGKYKELLQSMFPQAKVYEFSDHDKKVLNEKITYLKKFFYENYEVGEEHQYPKSDVDDKLKEYIIKYWGKKNINIVLKLIGINCERRGELKERRVFLNIET